MKALEYLTQIEAALEEAFPNRWRRMTAPEIKAQPPRFQPCIGWIAEINTQSTLSQISELRILVDIFFPNSQPRIIAPQMKMLTWPHIEWDGTLCLKASMSTCQPRARIAEHISWAFTLLNMPEGLRKKEFQREFLSYWGYSIPHDQPKFETFSLVAPGGPSRKIVRYLNLQNRELAFAEDRDSLTKWLANRGDSPSNSEIKPTWLEWLDDAWIPNEYPQTGNDLLKSIPSSLSSQLLVPGELCPIAIGARTETGTVFVAVHLHSAKLKTLKKGFRKASTIPSKIILNSFSSNHVRRYKVQRADAGWIHGRGNDLAYRAVAKRRVTIVGCGALGASISRLLAQAGISDFILIDGDMLETHNTSRHVLGLEYVGQNKAKAVAEMLQADFPHIVSALPIDRKFENLFASEMESVSKSDLIITAGVPYDCDINVDNFRKTLSQPPIYLATWSEEFALAGHAVALTGKDSLISAFDNEEQVVFRLTDWPDSSKSMVVEAGCGNIFQPHGAIDLQSTVGLAAGLALDAVEGKLSGSIRRVWMGDKTGVSRRGGIARPSFSNSRCIEEYSWQ